MAPEAASHMTGLLPLVDAGLRGALLATLLLLGALLARDHRRHAAGRTGIALMAGLVVQTLATVPPVEQGWPILWQAPLVGISIGNSVLFWLFARSLFDDEFSVGPAAVALWLAVVALGMAFCVCLGVFGPYAAPMRVLRFALRWVPVVFAALAITAAVRHWRGDLVERRRRLRAFIVVGGSVYALAMAALRLNSATGVLSVEAAGFDAGALLLVAFGGTLAMVRIADNGLLANHATSMQGHVLPPAASAPPADLPGPADPADPADRHDPADPADPADGPDAPEAAVSPDAADLRIVDALDRAMTRDHAYRTDGLTLGLLALKLAVPEYRLRRAINRHLGHRNFNAYINGLRLADARAALADPARRLASVLEIALEAGFASIGPFNRAFKAASGMTPTDYRERALADS